MNEEYTYSESERGFKGIWIPKEIWLDRRLTPLDKFVLMEINSLDNDETGCYASNKHIADVCMCSERKISECISKLIDLGYIERVAFDGRNRVIRTTFYLVCGVASQNIPTSKKMLAKHAKSAREARKKCDKVILESNITKNKRNIYKEKAAEIIAYLNEKISASYKPTTQATLSAISARLNEGFSVDDFKLVIDRKAEDWLNDSRMSKFLRPQTLFSPKFEGYLQEAKRKKKDESLWGEII